MTSPEELPAVKDVVPQREPFLMLDRVIQLTEERVVGVKLFRLDEPFFRGHFPERPIVPGVLLVEGMAQALAYWSLYRRAAKNVFLVGIERARFRSVVEPGQEVTFEIHIPGKERFGRITGKGTATVGGQRVADATVMGYSQ